MSATFKETHGLDFRSAEVLADLLEELNSTVISKEVRKRIHIYQMRLKDLRHLKHQSNRHHFLVLELRNARQMTQESICLPEKIKDFLYAVMRTIYRQELLRRLVNMNSIC